MLKGLPVQVFRAISREQILMPLDGLRPGRVTGMPDGGAPARRPRLVHHQARLQRTMRFPLSPALETFAVELVGAAEKRQSVIGQIRHGRGIRKGDLRGGAPEVQGAVRFVVLLDGRDVIRQ